MALAFESGDLVALNRRLSPPIPSLSLGPLNSSRLTLLSKSSLKLGEYAKHREKRPSGSSFGLNRLINDVQGNALLFEVVDYVGQVSN